MYNQITSNKRKTWILLLGFSVFAVGIVTLLAFQFGAPIEDALIGGTVFAVMYSVISFYVSDRVVLGVTGAKPIEKRDHPELYRIVENLSITAGLPTPKIYIINDPSPNAFATGRDPHHASVAFTTGLLQVLNKQELEGVVAHELGHVKNLDIRIMTLVVVLVGLVLLVSQMMLRMRFLHINNRSKDARGLMIVLLVVHLLVALLAPLVAQVIKLAISREREYLADATSALLTRYPAGLASALQKIRDHAVPMQKANDATAHLFISDPFGGKNKTPILHKLFMTHPPIEDRVARLQKMGS
ncbi:MAG: M48 family metalloprotease [bacterium]|nr:M48 family metalloprotease [bacterium]